MIHGKKTVLCIVLAVLTALTLATGAFAAEDDVILSDDASDFVLLSEAVPDAILEIRYYSTYNFVGDRIDGYEEPLALLTKEAAAALKEVSDDVMEQGYRLKIYDAYRPQMAVTNFMNWALDTEDTRMKEYFYPELDKDVLFPQGYIAEHSGHSRGSTVDLTLFDMTTEKEVDMGGAFDYFGELSHPDYTGITEEQYANRMLLRDAMLAHGFRPLAEEWWHFTLEDEPYPDTYFTFPVNSDSVEAEPLSGYWSADSAAAQQLRDYVKMVTDPEDTENYIPEKDRIAVFDMDGTLTCETYYTYYDTMMFIEYCLNDHPERVSDELKQIAASIQPGYTADETLARNFAKAYAGMTVEELREYAVEFGQKYTESFHNMRYIDNAYLPMVELVRYLYENGFTIYVISGTERTTTRAIIANSPFRDYVTPNHVIGTDFEVKQAGCESVSSNMDFKYEDGDELVITGGFIQKNLNGNKSIYIEREIGQRPVLAFGNSGSDTSMMNYTIDSRNPYPAQAYMIVADDDVREWGTQNWEEKSADYTAKGFIPISMKNDFARIYADGITKASEQYRERDGYLLDDAA